MEVEYTGAERYYENFEDVGIGDVFRFKDELHAPGLGNGPFMMIDDTGGCQFRDNATDDRLQYAFVDLDDGTTYPARADLARVLVEPLSATLKVEAPES